MTEDEIREKIYSEIVVDANGDDEVNTSWFYYFQDELSFPFDAEMETKTRSGKLQKIQVEVLELAEMANETSNIFVEVSQKGSDLIWKQEISKLSPIDPDEETEEVFEVWRYWCSEQF